MTDEPSDRHDGATAAGRMVPPEADVLAAASPRRRGWGRVGLVLTVVAGLALTAGGVAIAAGDSSTPKPSASPAAGTESGGTPPGPDLRFPGPDIGFLGIPEMGFAGPALHGEITVPKEGGGYEVLHIQRGVVRNVDASSLTVRSSDGFTETYAIGPHTIIDRDRHDIGDVKVGHRVALTGVDVNGTLTVRSLVDGTLFDKSIERFGAPKRPPFLGELRHFKMRWRAHVREWMRDGRTTSNGTESSSVVG